MKFEDLKELGSESAVKVFLLLCSAVSFTEHLLANKAHMILMRSMFALGNSIGKFC
jgi:hypothetical protein